MTNKKQLSEKEIQNIRGLSAEDVAARLARDGYNELPSAKKRSSLMIALEVTREPMFILLIACGLLYIILGDVGEAAMLLGFVFVIIGITIYQEGKAEKAIEALRDLSSPRALTIRDSGQTRIPGREVVRDDIIILTEGDRVPADATILWGINLSVDESLLTGESAPVRKSPSDTPSIESARPGGDDSPFVFSGTVVVQGQGIARVYATGANTEMGKIGKVLRTVEPEETYLQKETGRMVSKVFIAAIILCLLIITAYGLSRGDWLHAILSGITLAMAMLPEEFPVVLTIFLALGAWRLSKKNVLTRKVSAVEALGSATVLCVDKTGTLTENRMSIRKIFNGSEFLDVNPENDVTLPEKFHELVEYGILASKKDPFDPMEKALTQLGRNTLAGTEHIHMDWPLVEEYPLSKKMLALSHVWHTSSREGYLVAAKGAPEAIADLCHLSDEQKKHVSGSVQLMAGEGLRVLGVAGANYNGPELPHSQHDFDFKFVGLVGLTDPIRRSVPDAVKECRGAGIRVIMITGDYPVTAQFIARAIGLNNPERVLTGPEIETMSDEELKKNVSEINVFSRVVPEQKLLIVNALKACGEMVAMTGDGVNDAPALKSAHIGVAMGERGTDVAREASDIVLLKDDFKSIVEAVRLGRRIYDNIKKAMAYIISVHVPIAGCALVPILLNWPLILYPVHIVFLELIIDPACSIVFEHEPAEENIMARKPRDPGEPLFSGKMLFLSLLQGIFSFLCVIAVFRISLEYCNQTEVEARTLAFITLIISNICLILTNRSWTKTVFSRSALNKSLVFVIAGAITFLFVVLYVPFLQKLFHFGKMHFSDLLICLGAGMLSVVWFEIMKLFFKKQKIDLMK